MMVVDKKRRRDCHVLLVSGHRLKFATYEYNLFICMRHVIVGFKNSKIS